MNQRSCDSLGCHVELQKVIVTGLVWKIANATSFPVLKGCSDKEMCYNYFFIIIIIIPFSPCGEWGSQSVSSEQLVLLPPPLHPSTSWIQDVLLSLLVILCHVSLGWLSSLAFAFGNPNYYLHLEKIKTFEGA